VSAAARRLLKDAVSALRNEAKRPPVVVVPAMVAEAAVSPPVSDAVEPVAPVNVRFPVERFDEVAFVIVA